MLLMLFYCCEAKAASVIASLVQRLCLFVFFLCGDVVMLLLMDMQGAATFFSRCQMPGQPRPEQMSNSRLSGTLTRVKCPRDDGHSCI